MKRKKILFNFYFEKLGKNYFISNDSGDWAVVGEKEFAGFSKRDVSEGTVSGKILRGNFVKNRMDFESYFKKARSLKEFVFGPPSLHIIVITLKCNHFCRYCRATSESFERKDMTWATARKSLDFIFSTPNENITIEFQGGEALINWPVLKKSIDCALKMNAGLKKNLNITVVTNLSLMTADKLDYLLKRGVSICTSLDGPAGIHDRNRVFHGGSSHALARKWLKEIFYRVGKNPGSAADSLPSALMTTTKFSLSRPKEIVDEYRKAGLGGIFLRPLSPIGFAKSVWKDIGYQPEDFLSFYEKALKYVLEINKKGEKFVERNAAIKLKKMIFKKDPNFLDLRSPCGGAVGQLAYDHDGSIYTCDEGRMAGASGEALFKVGNVFKSSYKDVISSPNARLCLMCSCLENQILCHRCAFKPYCGVCPVHNYEVSGNPWGAAAASLGWCGMEKGIFKILVKALADKENEKIFKGWFD